MIVLVPVWYHILSMQEESAPWGADSGELQQWQEQQAEREKAQYKGCKLSDLFPNNYSSERDKFFQSNCSYDPHFSYNSIVCPQVIPLSITYQQTAVKILQNNKFTPHPLPVLSQEEVTQISMAYLQGLGLDEYVQLRFEPSMLSRTSVSFFKDKIVLKMRLPLEYNKVSLEGALNHEVGTHVIRRLNHKQNCVRKPSTEGKLIEEGLAVINQLINEDHPFLFKAALRYIASVHASKMGFADLFKQLKKYVKDDNDCWRQCVRVKRGMGNTAQKGGYYKDQSYLLGAVSLLTNRKSIDFRKIFYGKLSPYQTKSLNSGVLPPFLDSEEKHRHYLKRLDTMALCNFMDELQQ